MKKLQLLIGGSVFAGVLAQAGPQGGPDDLRKLLQQPAAAVTGERRQLTEEERAQLRRQLAEYSHQRPQLATTKCNPSFPCPPQK